MTTTQITCPHCQHTYQRTYPKPIICPECKMYLHGCYNRQDVSRADALMVQNEWWITQSLNHGDYVEGRYMVPIPNAFKNQTCQISLEACGDCKWRKQDELL